jgi:hypothetical protein
MPYLKGTRYPLLVFDEILLSSNYILDEDGNPILDEDGNPILEEN